MKNWKNGGYPVKWFVTIIGIDKKYIRSRFSSKYDRELKKKLTAISPENSYRCQLVSHDSNVCISSPELGIVLQAKYFIFKKTEPFQPAY